MIRSLGTRLFDSAINVEQYGSQISPLSELSQLLIDLFLHKIVIVNFPCGVLDPLLLGRRFETEARGILLKSLNGQPLRLQLVLLPLDRVEELLLIERAIVRIVLLVLDPGQRLTCV